MEFISDEFPGHSRLGFPLHPRNVLHVALLELWHGTKPCIKIYPLSGNTHYSHESVFHSHNNRQHCRDWVEKNEQYHAKCIQIIVKSPVRLQVWGAISSRGLSLLREVDGNMNSAKYQSDIIHDIEMTCECHKGYIFTCHYSKSTRTYLYC